MKILTLGDSFTKGSELADPVSSAWPSVLANIGEHHVTNEAEYGGSNDMMFRKAIELTAVDHYDLIVIAWTEAHRMEVYLNEPRDMEYRSYTVGPLSINHNWGNLKWTKEYYAEHYNEEYFLRKWLTQVIALQGYFKSRDQKYIFLNAFGNQQALPKYNLTTKQSVDSKYFLGWPNEGIVEWVYGLPKGKYGHPLEQAHILIAEKINESIRNFSWVS